jgi:hypothetical protein
MNHSCRPNCAGTELGLEIAIVDIPADVELTNDYCCLGIEDSEGFPCRCGLPDCRGVVAPAPSLSTRLRPRVRAAIELGHTSEQPLAELLAGGWRERALAQLDRLDQELTGGSG